MSGVVGGVVAFLLLWLILREQALFAAALAAVGSGLGIYLTALFRRKDRELLERRRQDRA